MVEPAARAAFVWILGEYGQGIQDAPYLLERLATSMAEEDVPVRVALLSACLKLFFKRPPECQKLLGEVLRTGCADGNLDVRDRALLYLRLLKHSLDTAKVVVAQQLPQTAAFAEEQSPEISDRVFDEFNSLSVVYNAPASQFLDQQVLVGCLG